MGIQLRFAVLVILHLLTGVMAKAQTYAIPDPNFRNFLAANIPSVLNASQQLIIANAKNYPGTISCAGQNIQDFSGLQYFHKITLINCANNQLTTLPSMDSLLSLKQLYAFNNKISSLPKLNKLVNLEVLNVKNNLLTSLPSLEGMTALKELDCSINQLNALPELNSLVNLEDFYCYKNSITVIPAITNLTKLKIFNVQANRLTQLPDLSMNSQLEKLQFDTNEIDSIPPLGHMTSLIDLLFYRNRIQVLPDLSNNIMLQRIYGQENDLKQLPDLSSLSNLIMVKLTNNLLSFEQIMPSVNHPMFATVFQVHPQDTITVNATVRVVQGTPYTIQLGIDQNVTGSSYVWYLNNSPVATTTVPQLSFSSADISQAGKYTVSISNNHPNLTGVTIGVNAATVEVGPCITASSVNYEILLNNCAKGATIQIDETSIIGPNAPFTYELIPLYNQKAASSQTASIESLMAGSYTLVIKDANNCSITLQNYVYIPSPTACTESFTPNGDGLEDTYFISKKGTAKIYTKNGLLIRTMQAPAHWDGTDDQGVPAPLGYYIILVNGKEKTGVVLID